MRLSIAPDWRNAATPEEAGCPEALQAKRDNFFVCEPIFDLKPGKFAHVHGASVGHLNLKKQKRKLPDIFKSADAP